MDNSTALDTYIRNRNIRDIEDFGVDDEDTGGIIMKCKPILGVRDTARASGIKRRGRSNARIQHRERGLRDYTRYVDGVCDKWLINKYDITFEENI